MLYKKAHGISIGGICVGQKVEMSSSPYTEEN